MAYIEVLWAHRRLTKCLGDGCQEKLGFKIGIVFVNREDEKGFGGGKRGNAI